MKVLGYISATNLLGESKGPSHAVSSFSGQKPLVACGSSVSTLNWTLWESPPTTLCKRCAKRISD